MLQMVQDETDSARIDRLHFVTIEVRPEIPLMTWIRQKENTLVRQGTRALDSRGTTLFPQILQGTLPATRWTLRQ
jgi:hypothetical protein